MQNWFVICGIFMLWSTELHINKYFGVNLKLLDLPLPMVLLNLKNSQKNKKNKYRGNFHESFAILSLENPFWLPRRVLRKFQGK